MALYNLGVLFGRIAGQEQRARQYYIQSLNMYERLDAETQQRHARDIEKLRNNLNILTNELHQQAQLHEAHHEQRTLFASCMQAAEMNWREQRTDQAEQYFFRAFDIMLALYQQNEELYYDDFKAVCDRLVAFYEATGRPEQADGFRI